MEVEVTIIPAKNWFGHAKFKIDQDVSIQGITAPKGFISDGATIPRWLTAIGVLIFLIAMGINNFWLTVLGCVVAMVPVVFPKTNKYFAAAVIHDYHLAEKLGTRKESDIIFRKCLRELGVQPWRYWPMYFAVRAWGILTFWRK